MTVSEGQKGRRSTTTTTVAGTVVLAFPASYEAPVKGGPAMLDATRLGFVSLRHSVNIGVVGMQRVGGLGHTLSISMAPRSGLPAGKGVKNGLHWRGASLNFACFPV